MEKILFTSESVTEGHPDKVCDQISDAILDEIISNDENCHVACETAITTGIVFVFGEITTKSNIDVPSIVRRTLRNIGYIDLRWGFDADSCAIITSIDQQSPDIALGVDKSMEMKAGSLNEADSIGAGDQGMMFGYACDDTSEFMPLPISMSHKLAKRLADVRKEGLLDYLGPDGKVQVTIEYDDEYTPVKVDTIVLSTQHSPEVSIEQLRKDVVDRIINTTIPQDLLSDDTKILVNPTGRFVVGGPKGDSGLTGRKIVVDTYGGFASHGGGAFSGKDPTKVDRSGAYMARYIAKNIVAAGLAKRCEVQIAYAIGVANPVSILINTYGTSRCGDDKLSDAVKNVFDLRPISIIKQFDLKHPIYHELASYGHMGREDLNVKWEKTDKVTELLEYLCENS